MKSSLMGWTLDQWAYAYARFKEYEHKEISPCLVGADKLMNWWRDSNFPDPMSVHIICKTAAPDVPWVAKMFVASWGEINKRSNL